MLACVLSPDAAAGRATGRRPLIDAVRATGATVLVLDRAAQDDDSIVAQAAELHEAGVRVRTLSLFYDEWLGKLPLSELERVSLLFDIGELHRARYGRVKRVLDVLLAAVGLVVAGRASRPWCWSATSSATGARSSTARTGSARAATDVRDPQVPDDAAAGRRRCHRRGPPSDDPRITPFGAWLRRTHLDELPQVAQHPPGRPVGGRPPARAAPATSRSSTGKLPFYRLRHLVRPGLTGWAQVKYGYGGNEGDALEKLQYEFFYLRHQGLALDAADHRPHPPQRLRPGRAMRITFVLPSFGAKPMGGYRIVYQFANGLVEGGDEVTVVHGALLEPWQYRSPLSLRREPKVLVRGLVDLVSRPREIGWQSIDPRVRLEFVPTLAAAQVPDADVVVATAWRTAESVIRYPASKGRQCYLVQHHEVWDAPATRVDATWRAPLTKIVIADWLYAKGLELGVDQTQLLQLPGPGIDDGLFRVTKPIDGRPAGGDALVAGSGEGRSRRGGRPRARTRRGAWPGRGAVRCAATAPGPAVVDRIPPQSQPVPAGGGRVQRQLRIPVPQSFRGLAPASRRGHGLRLRACVHRHRRGESTTPFRDGRRSWPMSGTRSAWRRTSSVCATTTRSGSGWPRPRST